MVFLITASRWGCRPKFSAPENSVSESFITWDRLSMRMRFWLSSMKKNPFGSSESPLPR